MMIRFHPKAWEDYLYWQSTDNRMLKRLTELLRAVQRDPFVGIGKPEPLRTSRSGYWSRRIDEEHRLVYYIEGEAVIIAQCRFHY